MTEKKKVTAEEIYYLLLNEFKIKEQIGSVEIILGGISAKYKRKVQFRPTEANAFFVELNYKKIVERKSRRD